MAIECRNVTSCALEQYNRAVNDRFPNWHPSLHEFAAGIYAEAVEWVQFMRDSTTPSISVKEYATVSVKPIPKNYHKYRRRCLSMRLTRKRPPPRRRLLWLHISIIWIKQFGKGGAIFSFDWVYGWSLRPRHLLFKYLLVLSVWIEGLWCFFVVLLVLSVLLVWSGLWISAGLKSKWMYQSYNDQLFVSFFV